MNVKLTALEASIAHWDRLANGADEDTGSESCALCDTFRHASVRWPCTGCPVKEKTGRAYCTGSPYVEVKDWLEKTSNNRYKHLSPEFHALAAKERDFLKSLLPETL